MKIGKILSKINYWKHQLSIDKNKKLRNKLFEIIKIKKKQTYDYGEGFFYQSIPAINLAGLRDTKQRLEILKLDEIVEGKKVLDIGCNIGSILIELKSNYKKAIGIDYNQECINVGKQVIDNLQKKKLELICEDFNTFDFKEKFDVVLSLANHSTFDKGISDTKFYFKKIKSLIKKGGVLVIESHAPLFEKKEDFEKTLNLNYILVDYDLVFESSYNFGNVYDRGRSFKIFQRKQ